MAIKKVSPEYPKTSQKRRSTGVAVAEVNVDEKGIVARVDILETPDEPIGTAVSRAVKEWRFSPTTIRGNEQVWIRGKLTFYFIIDSNGAHVENPKSLK